MVRSRKVWLGLLLAVLLGYLPFGSAAVHAEGEVSLYTPYTSLSAPPGESINYSIDVINNSSAIQNAQLSVDSVPDGWKYELTAGGKNIQQISVKPQDSQSISLRVDVPLKVAKGQYKMYVVATGMASLPLTINVSEEGTYKTELTTEQPNMEGHSDSTFNYSAKLTNHTAEKQLYALKADAAQGWDVQYKVDGKSVTSVSVEANQSKDIDIEINPPDQIKAGTYKVPVQAASGSTTASTEFQVVVTGTYGLELSTPTGLLSSDITAGHEKTIDLQVKNTGSTDIRGIEMSAAPPADWNVTFEPDKIEKLEPGKTADVKATIKADSNAIAGDYVVSMTAQSPEKTSDAQFRISVKTSVLWGWLGILIILAVVGGIYYLFRTYGRR